MKFATPPIIPTPPFIKFQKNVQPPPVIPTPLLFVTQE